MENEAFGCKGLRDHDAYDGDEDPNDKWRTSRGPRAKCRRGSKEFVKGKSETEENGNEDASDGAGSGLPEENATNYRSAECEKEEVTEFTVEFDAAQEVAEDNKREDKAGQGE